MKTGTLKKYIPDVALMDGALREAFFLPLFGRIVSLLALVRRVPPCSIRPDAMRSVGGPRVPCGMELMVSVSTVMFLAEASALGLRLLTEALGITALARGVVSWSCSSASLFCRSFFFSAPVSLPLSPFETLAFPLRGVVAPEAAPWSSSDCVSAKGDSALL